MARSGILKTIANMNTQQIESLSKKELVDYVAKGSKLLAQNVRRLSKSELGESSFLIRKRAQAGKPIVTERKAKQLQNLSVTKLKKELRSISYTAKAKTSSIVGTKKFIEDIKSKTGVDVSNLTSSDWEKIRRKIESSDDPNYSSEDAISEYNVSNESYDSNYEENYNDVIKENSDEKIISFEEIFK